LNNAVDHPGVPFAKAADTLELVKRVNHPHLRLNLDLYHAQIGEGNLTQLVSECFEWIGEIQVADVPGRAQPGSGEIYYPRIAKELKGLNYQGVIAMEAFATGESHQALAEFRSAFTV
jgi:hydroxypyruvate isomerase